MLVLSRQKNEAVIVDLRKYGLGLASIAVADIRGDKVRLAFQFPDTVPVNREEVHQAIERHGSNKVVGD